MHRILRTYGSLERVDLASVGLDLVTELHGLQLGLSESIIILAYCLVQICHLWVKQNSLSQTPGYFQSRYIDLHIAFVYLSKISYTDLRLVPFLSLGDILGSDSLVLRADVPEGGSQVWFGHVHLDLHLTLLHLVLQLTDLLKEKVNRETWLQSALMYSHFT